MKTVHELKPQIDPDLKKHRTFQEYAEMASNAGLSVLGTARGFHGNVMDKELIAHQLANAAMLQLFDVSAIAPGDLRDKILAFQDEVRALLVHYLKEAMRSEQQRIGMVLEASGHSNAASLVKV